MADTSPANTILMADSLTNPANMPATLVVNALPVVQETKSAPEKDFNLMAFSATNPANMRAGLIVKPPPVVEEVIAPVLAEVTAEATPVVAEVTLAPTNDSNLMALSATNPANMPAGVFRPTGTIASVVEVAQPSQIKAVDPPAATEPVISSAPELVQVSATEPVGPPVETPPSSDPEPAEASIIEPVVLSAPESVPASVPESDKTLVEDLVNEPATSASEPAKVQTTESASSAPEPVQAPAVEHSNPTEAPIPSPFPISHIAGRYLLFDVNVISHARRTHNITGVLVGTIPNLSQQNVFLGIPLELQPEEARVLVEQGYAYIVDDAEVHRKGMLEMSREERMKFLREMDKQGTEIAGAELKRAEERAEKALKEKGLSGKRNKKEKSDEPNTPATTESSDSTLFHVAPAPPTPVKVSEKKLEPMYITPTTSYPPLTTPPTNTSLPLPEVPKSYPLFRFLHQKGYFMMPGLRFGCHYSVYPGDTLRFHSHYLATGLEWDEEFELKDLIGGGRLANRVKKAYLLGGEIKVGVQDELVNEKEVQKHGVSPVRAFSIEWAGL